MIRVELEGAPNQALVSTTLGFFVGFAAVGLSAPEADLTILSARGLQRNDLSELYHGLDFPCHASLIANFEIKIRHAYDAAAARTLI